MTAITGVPSLPSVVSVWGLAARGRVREAALRCAAMPGLVLAEARPVIVAIFGVRLAVSSGMFGYATTRKGMVALGWVLLTVAAYVFNGMRDVAEDRVNGSRRPLASGRLAVREAAIAVLASAVAGLGLCWAYGGVVVAACGIGSLGLGWAYSAGPALKRSAVGTVVSVSGAASLTYLAGGSVAAVSRDGLVVFLLVAAWVGGVCPVKDLSDVAGDRVAGRRTLPVVLGPRLAALVVVVTAGTVSAVVVMVAVLTVPRFVPVGLVMFCGSIAVAVTVLRAGPATSRWALRRAYRVFMGVQFATNLALVLCIA